MNRKYTNISSIKIHNLFGNRDITLDFKESVRILIGENGLGKTTILAILNSILTGNIQDLTNYDLKSISIKFKNDSVKQLTQEIIDTYYNSRRYILEDISLGTLLEFEKLLFNQRIKIAEIEDSEIRRVCYKAPKLRQKLEGAMINTYRLLSDFINANLIVFELKYILFNEKYNVIYLPTYRRIETDLRRIIKNCNINQNDYYKRLNDFLFCHNPEDLPLSKVMENPYMHFGMKDIVDKINILLQKITKSSIIGFSEVSANIIKGLIKSSSNKPCGYVFDAKQIEIVLQRIGDRLDKESKSQIIQYIDNKEIDNNPILGSLLNSLVQLYKKQEIYDRALKNFAKACNTFLFDKVFIYDESNVKLDLYFKTDKTHKNQISLEKLSSGEKQIIALMAHAYLEINKKMIFLIDEPELSLSLMWQRNLLPELFKANNCSHILVVTHSPFIFDNQFKYNALGTDEYVTFIH